MRALIIRINMVPHYYPAPHTQEEHEQYVPPSKLVYSEGEMKTVIRSQVIRSQGVYIVHYMYIMVYNIMSSHIYPIYPPFNTDTHAYTYTHT